MPLNARQRMLATIACVIVVVLTLYGFVNGGFAEASVFMKVVKLINGTACVVLLWTLWVRRPPAVDSRD